MTEQYSEMPGKQTGSFYFPLHLRTTDGMSSQLLGTVIESDLDSAVRGLPQKTVGLLQAGDAKDLTS